MQAPLSPNGRGRSNAYQRRITWNLTTAGLSLVEPSHVTRGHPSLAKTGREKMRKTILRGSIAALVTLGSERLMLTGCGDAGTRAVA